MVIHNVYYLCGTTNEQTISMELNITENGAIITAVLTGRLDTTSSSQFAVDMMPLMYNADKHIVIDCTNLEYVASSGLRQLLLLRKETIAKRGDVTLKNVTPGVRQVFTIAGFSSLFSFE